MPGTCVHELTDPFADLVRCPDRRNPVDHLAKVLVVGRAEGPGHLITGFVAVGIDAHENEGVPTESTQVPAVAVCVLPDPINGFGVAARRIEVGIQPSPRSAALLIAGSFLPATTIGGPPSWAGAG